MDNLWHNLVVFWAQDIGGWRPVVEVLILTVGIYSALRFVRGTRGAPVVMGFLVVLLALVLTSFLLKLKVLQYLLGAFYAFFLLAVLVIFQPELRRMLAELGNLPLLATVREQRENIEVIVQTVERLSEVRIGALIAIERSIHLQQAVESGIIVNCVATPRCWRPSSSPTTPSTTVASSSVGDRIAFAACIFPLTQRRDLNPSLGTRHRAAIGLSEETDAAVVVVSEETGGISYASKGHLVRNVTPRGTAGLSDLDVRLPRPLAHLDRLGPVLDHRKGETGPNPCGPG